MSELNVDQKSIKVTFPDNDRTKFDRDNEYFPSLIVTFKNDIA